MDSYFSKKKQSVYFLLDTYVNGYISNRTCSSQVIITYYAIVSSKHNNLKSARFFKHYLYKNDFLFKYKNTPVFDKSVTISCYAKFAFT